MFFFGGGNQEKCLNGGFWVARLDSVGLVPTYNDSPARQQKGWDWTGSVIVGKGKRKADRPQA